MSSKVVSAPLKAVPKAGAPPKAAAQKAAIVKYVPCAAPGTISGAVLAKVVSMRQQGAQGLRKAGVLKISTGQKRHASVGPSLAQAAKQAKVVTAMYSAPTSARKVAVAMPPAGRSDDD
jgi:hypothetical protein